jgi:putative CocE/NonD family hydrolase
LVTIVPLNTPADQFEDHPYRDGALMGNWMPDWVAMMSGRTEQTYVSASSVGGWLGRFEAFKQTPYRDINARRGIAGAPWVMDWYSQNKASDPYWKGIAYQDQDSYSKMTVASLSVTGWFDVSFAGSPANYNGMKKFGATQQARRPSLIIGPWSHVMFERSVGGIDYGPEATFDVKSYSVRWFDHFLKGIDNGIENDFPVHVFVMGENRWHAERDWPLPQTVFTKYYLDSSVRVASLSGALTTLLPRTDASDSYTYDPNNPTLDPTAFCKDGSGNLDGAWDTGSAGTTDDVLVYETPSLTSPVEVTGPVEATLYAVTSVQDTDWMVRLLDVQPDGRSLLLADGVLRARSRGKDGRFNAEQLSTIDAGKIYKYTIRFWRGTGNLFKQGHRIRLEISSSWYPFFLPNLNSGSDNLADIPISKARVARQTVHHGPKFPSHVVLPIIPHRGPNSAVSR